MPDVVASVWPQDDGSTGPFYLQCPCYAGSVKWRARPGPGALGAGSATQRLGHGPGGLADQVVQVGPTAVFPPPVAGPSGPSPLEATSIDSPRRRSLNGLGGLGLTEEGQAAVDLDPPAPVPAPTRPTARTSRAQLFQCLVRDEPVHLELSDARLHRRTRYSQHTTRASSTGQESATVSCSQSMLRSPFFCPCCSQGSVGGIHATAGLHSGPPHRTKKRRARNRWVHDRIATVSGHRNRQCAGVTAGV